MKATDDEVMSKGLAVNMRRKYIRSKYSGLCFSVLVDRWLR